MLLKRVKRPITFLDPKKNSYVQLVLAVPHEAKIFWGTILIARKFSFFVIVSSNFKERN